MVKGIGVEDALVVRVRIIVAEIKNLPLAGVFSKQAQQAAGILNGELTAAANQTPKVVGKAAATAKASTAG